MMELLSPAGSFEALQAAVNSGADAVYLGYTAFSARAGAGNFNQEELRRAVGLCHLHHVRVHVTVNILLKEFEMPQVREVLSLLSDCRVDAVIVQDLGVARVLREEYPQLPVHASTQMSLHNAAGARFAKKWGFDRVVLARECSLEEIKKAADTGIEVETFVHGALCVGVSGQCLFSSMVGGRSGNRGRCAQPCRLNYRMGDERGALLSPRDICLRDHLDTLQKAGVKSLKIEGRLKRPEYVATVTGSYRKALDELAKGRFRPADMAEKEALLQIFNRGGFMGGYAAYDQDAGVIYPRRVNHEGLPMGRVLSVKGGFAQVLLERDLNDGDGLQFRGRKDTDAIYAGPRVFAGQQARIRLRPESPVTAGDHMVRLTDAEQMKAAQAVTEPLISIEMRLEAYPGRALKLTLTDGVSTISVEGEAAAPAQSRPMTEESAAASLMKLGGTPFACNKVNVRTENAFVPVSVLNALRREGIEKFTQQRIADFETQPERLPTVLERRQPPRMDIASAVITRTGKEKADLVIYEPEDYSLESLQVPEGAWLLLPPQCTQDYLESLCQWLKAHPIAGVVLGTVGQLGMDWPVPYAAGPGIPIMNRTAAQTVYDWGCQFAFASPELTGRELDALAGYPLLVTTYGSQRLMVLNHCPARTALGLKKGHEDCRLCDRHAPGCLEGRQLTDRMGESFPLLRTRLPSGCLVGVYNSRTLDVTQQEAGLIEKGFIPAHSLMGIEHDKTTTGHWTRQVE